MNKTLTINISGIIFHVEEDAYDRLSRYLSTIKSYFAASDGRDEIMADIESRIAELLKEKVSTARQVVLMNDVEAVIAIMGKPEDFADGETSASASYDTEASREFIPKRRRIFRDPDDAVIGGVCSGISNYFDMDPIWLRIIWAVSIFAFGAGFLLYILLWIIIPKAVTTAEKLEMKGERVNINNIEKTIREELEHLKKKVNDIRDDSGPVRNNARSVIHKIGNLIAVILKGAINLIGKVLYGILVFIAIVLLIALLSSIFGNTSVVHINNGDQTVSYGLHEILRSVMTDSGDIKLAVLALSLFLGVPLMIFLFNAISRMAGVKRNFKAVNIGATILWLAGLGLCFYVANKIAVDFKEEAIAREKITLAQPSGDILYLKVQGDESFHFESRSGDKHWTFFRKDDEGTQIGNAELNILPSETDSFMVVVKKSARGETKKEAMGRAKDIIYSFTQNDSIVEFANYFTLKEKDQFRAQEVEITVLVPKDKKVYLNRNMKSIIYDVDNIHDIYDDDMVGRTWVMTPSGLDCVDCAGLEEHIELRKEHRRSFEEHHAPPTPPSPPSHHKETL